MMTLSMKERSKSAYLHTDPNNSILLMIAMIKNPSKNSWIQNFIAICP